MALPAFVALFLIVAAHTTLETARDAIFLAKLPPRDLNVAYVVLAGITLVAAALSTKLSARVGRRNALIGSLLLVSLITAGFFVLTPTPGVALSLYLFTGLEGILAPQFWILADDLFTVNQARRLFGSITAGGVAGGVAGAGSAALIARALPVSDILPVTAVLFVLAAFAVFRLRLRIPEEGRASLLLDAPPEDPRAREVKGATTRKSAFQENPLLTRIAALVGLSTATVLVVDYLFKSTAAHAVPPESLGFFFARYYAVMNAVSLLVQVFLAGRVVRRIGVIGAASFTPLLLLVAGLATVLGQGRFFLVLCLKTCDGALRYSLNRVATELLYLPIPAAARLRAKAFIDSALTRIVQASTATCLYVLAVRHLATPPVLAAGVAVLALFWSLVAVTLRGAYLDLFRRALGTFGLSSSADVRDLDMTSAGALVEALASPLPVTVVAAMDVLEQHDQTATIPALILYHDHASVLIRALSLFGQSPRTDWLPLAERLLKHRNEDVATASVRALARAGRLEAFDCEREHPSARVQGYVAFYRAEHDAGTALESHPLITAVMERSGPEGQAARRTLVNAIADTLDPRAVDLLLTLAELPEMNESEAAAMDLAAAIAALRNERLIPVCIRRLTRREAREAMREALVAIGRPALDALEALIDDPTVDRRLRLHLPRTISRFGTQRAADILVRHLLREKGGMVRYKVLRALGQLVAGANVKIDRKIMEGEATRNLEEYLRLLSFRVALSSPSEGGRRGLEDVAKLVLLGLLDDKLEQSMERAFRLLQIAYQREDIESVHAAARSPEKAGRANAGEFLDVLLVRRDEQRLRRLLRIVVDDAADVDRVAAARDEVPALARSYEETLVRLLDDRDEVLVALAASHALSLDDEGLKQAVQRVQERSPMLEKTSELLFGCPLRRAVPTHA